MWRWIVSVGAEPQWWEWSRSDGSPYPATYHLVPSHPPPSIWFLSGPTWFHHPSLACPQVSVTFDPFCYLSLPLPMKKERQIDVFFIAANPEARIVQYKLTVPKLGLVDDLCQVRGVPAYAMEARLSRHAQLPSSFAHVLVRLCRDSTGFPTIT